MKLFLLFVRLITLISARSQDGLHFVVEPNDLIVEEGSSARLDCIAKSNFGHPTIVWLNNNGESITFEGNNDRTLLGNGSLYFNHIQASSTLNRFQCLATVKHIGAIISRSASIEIFKLAAFEREPQDYMIYAGQTAYLFCKLTSMKFVVVHWLKDNFPLFINDSRMTVFSTGSLEIDSFSSQDIGSYRCNVSGYGQFRLSNNAQLSLQINDFEVTETAPVFVVKPFVQTALEGSTVTLECAANGNPKPNIFWLKEGISIDYAVSTTRYHRIAASSLVITNVREEDQGSYQCRAANVIETLDAATEITVLVPPRFTKFPQDVNAEEKEDCNFECEIYGIPQPKITWLKNGNPIKISEWHVVTRFNFRINGLLSTDEGIYQCFGENQIGTVQASAQLSINRVDINSSNIVERTATSVMVMDLNISTLSSTSVTLRLQDSNLNSDNITNYLIYYKSDGSERERMQNVPYSEKIVKIAQLRPGTTYEFRGVANMSGILNFFTQPLLVTTHSEPSVPSPPINLRGYVKSSTSIKIFWTEPSAINGRLLSYVITYKTNNDQVCKNSSDTTYDLDNLIAYTSYVIWIQAANENGVGATSDEIRFRTFSAPPSQPPNNVRVEVSGLTNIIVRWQLPFTGRNGIITGYKIRWRRLDRQHRVNSITTDANRYVYEIRGLEKDVSYQIRICALNINGTGPYTEWLNVENDKYFTKMKVLSAPNITETKATSDTILVKWEPPRSQAIKVKGYRLSWGKGIPDNYTVDFDEKQRQFIIQHLEPKSEYVIILRARNQAGEGLPNYKIIKTIERFIVENSSKLTPPVGLKVIPLRSDAMVLQWTDTDLQKSQHLMDNRYYIIRYAIKLHNNNLRFYNSSINRSCVIHGLKRNTEYEFAVKIVKERRESPWSMVVSNRTLADVNISPPTNLQLQRSSENAEIIVLHWNPPKESHADIIRYILSYSIDKNKLDRDWNNEIINIDTLNNKPEYSLKMKLLENMTYYFKIRAGNNEGYGPFSAIISLTIPKSTVRFSKSKMYIIGGCLSIVILFAVTGVAFLFWQRKLKSQARQNRYATDSNLKLNIKPPDLWIHHDQMELKALEKLSRNGDSPICGIVSNTLHDLSNDSSHETTYVHSNSFDKPLDRQSCISKKS